jgi:hypothetical protein
MDHGSDARGRPEAGGPLRDLIALAFCCAVGALISALPHLIEWARTGEPAWIADYDEAEIYLGTVGRAYRFHPAYLSDPVPADDSPSIYPWLQMAPGVLLARALGLGPMRIGFLWRLWAGVSIAACWYGLLRLHIRRPAVAAAVAAFLLLDVGVLTSHLLVRQALVSYQVALGRTENLFDSLPRIHTQWRIISPGLSLGFLLAYLWLLARARSRPSPARVAAAGLGFGLLFHVYFYFWTAASLGLLVALALDAEARRTYLHVSWIGWLAGLPAIWTSYRFKASHPPDWLLRSDLFLPIPRGSELLVPRATLAILLLGLGWVWLKRRDLIPLWSLCLAGLLLSNHQVVTGLQIQNYHWRYVWGPCGSLLLVLIVAGEVASRIAPRKAADEWTDGEAPPRAALRRAVAWTLAILWTLHLAAGFWLRFQEATRTPQSVALVAAYRKYRAQREAPGAPPLAPLSAVAGSEEFADFSVILEGQRPLSHYAVLLSPTVADPEYDHRVALNGFLRGLDRARYVAEQEEELAGVIWGPAARDPGTRDKWVASRALSYDAVAAAPADFLERFGVRYLALPVGESPPPVGRGRWQLRQDGPSWGLWEYDPSLY